MFRLLFSRLDHLSVSVKHGLTKQIGHPSFVVGIESFRFFFIESIVEEELVRVSSYRYESVGFIKT